MSATYRHHFGSLGRAYQLVGYFPHRVSAFTEINQRLRRLYSDVHRDVLSNIQQLGGTVAGDGKKDLITINGDFTCSIVIARCTSIRVGGVMRWKLRLDTIPRPDVTVAVRLAPGNQQAMDYYLLPKMDVTASRVRLAESNGIFLYAYRFDSLDRFFEISARTRLRVIECPTLSMSRWSRSTRSPCSIRGPAVMFSRRSPRLTRTNCCPAIKSWPFGRSFCSAISGERAQHGPAAAFRTAGS